MIHLPPLLAASAVFYGVRWLRRGRVGTEDAARTIWADAHPGDDIQRCAISQDGRAALVQSDWGMGVIGRNGRLVQRLDMVAVERAPDGLIVHVPGHAVPISLSQNEAADWHDRLSSSPKTIEAPRP